MRALGVDLGERRIGVAVSDSAGVIASPYTVLVRSGDPRADRLELARVAVETGAEVVVVGLPFSLSGGEGPAAKAAEREIESLRGLLAVPVVAFDERLTTVEAARRRRERTAAGGGRGGSRARRRDGGSGSQGGRRAGAVAGLPIDAEAAAVLLDAWLSLRRRDG